MKNIRKYIVLSILLFLITLNNVSAYEYTNGTLLLSGYAEIEYLMGGYSGYRGLDETTHTMLFHYKSTDITGEIDKIEYDLISIAYNGDYSNIPQSVGAPFSIRKGAIEVGTGGLYIFKDNDRGASELEAKMVFYFSDNFIGENDIIYNLVVYTDPLYSYFENFAYLGVTDGEHPLEYDTVHLGVQFEALGSTMMTFKSEFSSTACTVYKISNFKNEYSLATAEYNCIMDLKRVFSGYEGTSDYIIRNETNDIMYNSGYESTDEIYNKVNDITYKHYIKPQFNEVEYLIYEYTPPEEPEDITPTLTTDKTNYNLSETIEISYTNINEVAIPGDSYTLYILYPVIDDYKEYEAKFMQHLYSDERDETFIINTSFLSPQNEYYLGISEPGAFHRTTDHIIMSDVFYVYDDNEYLTTSCNIEGNCYTYNGGDISIYYKINNNSDIIIKDNNENIIHTYYDIIDEGEINFYIPDDENKLNSYPNWKIYLNNTEYETNYTTDVTVYWSLITTPTPTPIYTSVPTDENVSEMIDELKDESKPIFDLIYGLSELVVDNPDYDDDDIITENEMNNWFNSLIPIVLILLIFIVYTGLSKRR